MIIKLILDLLKKGSGYWKKVVEIAAMGFECFRFSYPCVFVMFTIIELNFSRNWSTLQVLTSTLLCIVHKTEPNIQKVAASL